MNGMLEKPKTNVKTSVASSYEDGRTVGGRIYM